MIISLFPLIFMLHEFEEMVYFKPWIAKNGAWLIQHYPQFAKPVKHLGALSMQAFVLAVWEEFVLVGVITVLALTLQWYEVWMAGFTAFALHILLHLLQWGIVRRYIPVVVTSLLSLPYLIWGLYYIGNTFSGVQILWCFGIGVPVATLNLYLVHKVVSQHRADA